MRSIDVLMDEHQFILRLLVAMESWAVAPGADRANLQLELRRFVAIIQGFVDPIHHGKEEDILFATLVAEGFPHEHGPLPCMLAEHARCRAYVAEMSRLAAFDRRWDDVELGAAIHAVEQYRILLTAHIGKEDHVLYPMAIRFLAPHARTAVDEAAAAFDVGPGGLRAAALVRDGEALIAELTRSAMGEAHAAATT